MSAHFDPDASNISAPRTNSPSRQFDRVVYVHEDQPDPVELLVDPTWPRDRWHCDQPAVVEFTVTFPALINPRVPSLGCHPERRRRYVFGPASPQHSIPQMYRPALRQRDREGRVAGGLFPLGRIVGEGTVEYSADALRTMAGGQAPWSPPPAAAKSVSERMAPTTPASLDDDLMSEVTQ